MFTTLGELLTVLLDGEIKNSLNWQLLPNCEINRVENRLKLNAEKKVIKNCCVEKFIDPDKRTKKKEAIFSLHQSVNAAHTVSQIIALPTLLDKLYVNPSFGRIP